MVKPSACILSLRRPAAPWVPEALATRTVKLALFTVVVVVAIVVEVAVGVVVVAPDPPVSTDADESKPFFRISMPSNAAITTTNTPRAAMLPAGLGGVGR